LTYVGVFLVWKQFPSRALFLGVGTLASVGLATGLIRARRTGYFVNRVDFSAHALVVADLAIESVVFELFRLAQPLASVTLFHDNNNFIGCAAAFVALVGGYRWYALRTKVAQQP
ncbi:MAG: hypothetical protein KDA63_14705, partial [Planctomycetales bacterium]|nr:hypothetical protein [Planctomycetales bacterium]